MTFLVTVKTVLVSRLNMGAWLSKIKKESKSERDFQRHTRKSRRSKSFTLDWTGRKRSKANRASTRSENLSPELKWKPKSQTKWHADINADQTCSSNAFDTNRRHTTTVEEQSENKNYFQDACIPTNQDTTVKPKSTNKSNLDIAHEIVLQIENRRAGKAKRMKTSQNSSTTGDMKKNSSNLLKGTGNKSTSSQQHNRISSTNQKISLLANNTNSLVRDSDISKIGSKKAASVKLIPAESKTKIIDVNAQAVIQKAISDGQEKKTVQHENLLKVKQNYENRKEAILHDPLNIIGSNKLASVELEDKTKKNILSECKTKVISANTQEVIEPIEEIKTSNNQNAISDGQQPKKFQVMQQNYESRENIIFLSHIFMDKIDVEKEKINLPWQDFTNFKKDTGNRQNCDNATLAKAIEDRSNMDGKSKEENSAPTTLVDVTPKFEQNDEMNDEENIFKELTILFQENIPICDQVVKSGNVETDEDNLQCQEADEVVYQSTKYEPCDSVLLPIVCDNVKLQTTEVNIPTEAVDETSSKPKQLITNLENKKVDKVDEKESIPPEKIVKLLQDDQTIPLNSDALWLSSAEDTIFRKNIKTFLMQDCEEIDLCANKADQENSISENPFCTKVKEQFLELTGEAISSHNDCADDTVNQNNPEGLYYSEDEHITSDNLFMQKSIDESDNASDKVSKPRKDEIDNVFEDLLILVKEDNLKTTSLPVSVSIPENNPSPNARDEVGQKITDYTVAKKIEDIKCKAEPFREEIEAFFELEDSNKYFYIEESLQRLVAKLDDMYDEIGDDEWLRQRRKFVYKFIFSLFDALDEKVKINARNVQL